MGAVASPFAGPPYRRLVRFPCGTDQQVPDIPLLPVEGIREQRAQPPSPMQKGGRHERLCFPEARLVSLGNRARTPAVLGNHRRFQKWRI